MLLNRIKTQNFRRRPATAETLILSQALYCENCGGQISIGSGCSPSGLACLVSIITATLFKYSSVTDSI